MPERRGGQDHRPLQLQHPQQEPHRGARVRRGSGLAPAARVEGVDHRWEVAHRLSRVGAAPTPSEPISRRWFEAGEAALARPSRALGGSRSRGRRDEPRPPKVGCRHGLLPRRRLRTSQAAHPAPRRDRLPLPRGADGGGGVLLRLLAALPPRRAVGDRRQPGLGAARPDPDAQPPAQAAAPQAARAVPGASARAPAHCPVEGRRLVLGNNDVRITYVVTGTDPSPIYRNAIGDECVYVQEGTRHGRDRVRGAALPHRRLRAGPARDRPPLGPGRASRGSTPSRPTPTSPRPSATCRASGSCSSTRRTASATSTARPSRTSSRAPTSRCWSSTASPACPAASAAAG